MLRPLQRAQLGRDLDALRFAAGQRRRRLSERQVAQPEIVQHLDLPAHGGLACEKRHAFLDRHVQNVVDGLAAERHLECLAVEARALAGAACDFDVRHEVQLRGDDPFALAFLAAAAFDVEAETSRLVATLDRERSRREQVANRVVETHVGRGIRTAVPSDRGLVDADDLVHMLRAVDTVMLSGQRARIHQPLPQRLVKDLVDERALAGSRCAGDGHQLAERKA